MLTSYSLLDIEEVREALTNARCSPCSCRFELPALTVASDLALSFRRNVEGPGPSAYASCTGSMAFGKPSLAPASGTLSIGASKRSSYPLLTRQLDVSSRISARRSSRLSHPSLGPARTAAF